LQIIYRPLDGLRPDPANPRCHSKKQVRQIAESIKAFGFNVPILIDRDGNVVAGHGRLAACRELGMTQVPTLCLDHLTPAQLRAFRIADNRLTEIATWDDRLLAEQLKDLSLLGLDFSLEVTGFDMAEIDLRILSLENPPEDDDPADGVPGVAAESPQLSRGQVIEAQRRRLGHAQLAAGSEATVPCDHVAIAIDQDRHIEAKGLDALGNLPDLLSAVASRVSRVRSELVQQAVDDLRA
jgi:ParB-like chromosome segregation protein Spo0J